MNEIIKIENREDELIVDSRHLANLFEIQHESVLRLIYKFENEFNMLGLIRFEIGTVLTKNSGNQETKFCWLSEAQCNLLITFFKNSEIAVKAKLHLIQSFEKAKKLLKKTLRKQINTAWQEARQLASKEYLPMSEAVKDSREAKGKETKAFHYSNEANLICLVLKGMTVKKYKELFNEGHFRDNLSSEELAMLTRLQSINTGLIHAGWDYEQRKQYLTKYYEEKKDKLRVVRSHQEVLSLTS